MRLKSKRIPEDAVISAIIDYLHIASATGKVCWFKRNNGGAMYTVKGRWIGWPYRLFRKGKKEEHKGFPDIDVLLTDSRYLMIEVKGEKTPTSDEQAELIEESAKYCGAKIVHSVDEVVEMVEGK